MPHDLSDLIADSLVVNADRLALVTQDGQKLTYRKIGETIDAFAARASAEGIRSGQIIHIDIENYAIELCLMFALSRLGAVIVMGGTVQQILNAGIHLDAVISIDLRPNPKPRNILFHADWFKPAETGRTWPGYASADETVLIGASSGSTGQRKFMRFSTAQMSARTANRAGSFNQPEEMAHKRRLITLGVSTIVGFTMRIRCLQSGGMMTMPAGSARGTLELVRDLEIEEIFAPPALAAALLKAQKYAPLSLPALQRIVIGGGSVSANICHELTDHLDCEVNLSYGASEVGNMASGSFADIGSVPGAVGYLGHWVEGRAFDDALNPLADGETGQLGFRVPENFRVGDYINPDPDQRAVFHDGWFYSGDVGRVESDGLLVFSGRVNELINTGGNKFAPRIIETKVTGRFGVVQAAAVGIANEAGFDDIGVAVVGEEELDLDGVRAHLVAEFGSLVSLRVIEVEDLPVATGGKIDRTALKNLF